MIKWKTIVDVWKKLNTPIAEEKEKTEEELIKDRLGDYILPDSFQKELSDFDKQELARKTFQKTIPTVSRKTVTDSMGKTKVVTVDEANYETDFVKSMMNDTVPDVIYTHFMKQGFIGWEACATLKQNWIINNACNIPPQDAIRPGYKLSLTNKETTDELSEKIEAFRSLSIKKYKILDICATAVEKKKVFGSCLVVPIFNDDIDLSVPFNPDSVKPNSYKGLVVVEPRWLEFNFDDDSINNPLSSHFFEPTWFVTMNNRKKVHKSWCIHLKNTLVPDVLKPTYFYGGIPLTQMLYQRVYAAEKVANEAPMLAMSKRLLVVDIPLITKLTNPTQVQRDIDQLVNYRDNWGVISKRPGEGIQQIDTSLADFESVLMSQYQLVAAIAQMPATKLLKAQPTGMNATGEYDFKDYVQSLETIQDNDMKPIINLHNKLLALSSGEKYDFITTFNPIDVPTKTEMAQVNSSKAQVLSGLVSSGIISQDEARDVLRADEDTDFTGLADAPATENSNEEAEVNQLLAAMKQGKPSEATDAAEFIESEHPRDKTGKFTKKGTGSSSGGSISENKVNFSENFKSIFRLRDGEDRTKEFSKEYLNKLGEALYIKNKKAKVIRDLFTESRDDGKEIIPPSTWQRYKELYNEWFDLDEDSEDEEERERANKLFREMEDIEDKLSDKSVFEDFGTWKSYMKGTFKSLKGDENNDLLDELEQDVLADEIYREMANINRSAYNDKEIVLHELNPEPVDFHKFDMKNGEEILPMFKIGDYEFHSPVWYNKSDPNIREYEDKIKKLDSISSKIEKSSMDLKTAQKIIDDFRDRKYENKDTDNQVEAPNS